MYQGQWRKGTCMLLSGQYGNLKNPDAWKNSKLGEYLLYGTWEAPNGLRILAGYQYHEADYRAELSILELYNIEWSAELRLKHLNESWIRDLRDQNEVAAPKIFIDWALSKKIRPTWLDWAIQQGLYKENNETDSMKPDFDKESPTYPPELDIAVQVWREISATEGKGKPKARIRTWLDDNAPNLSGEAKERIATVANWDKAGGPTRSGK